MKYLKTYEEIYNDAKFSKGDIVFVSEIEGLFTIGEVETSFNVFGDYTDSETYVYKLKGDNEKELSYDWYHNGDLRFATTEEIKEYNFKKNIKNYNV